MERELTPAEVAKYQQDGNCPFCGEDNVQLTYDSGTFDGRYFSQEVNCHKCNSTWYVVYQQTGLCVCVDGTGHDYDFPTETPPEPEQPAPVPAETEAAPDAIRQALAPILQKTRGQPPFDEWPATGCQIYLTREQLDAIRAIYDSTETEGNPS
jgi:hypothetical protein